MEQDYQFAELWREAFTIYKKSTGRDLLLEISKHPSLQSVEGLQQMIEQTDKNFNAFRHRHAIWDYLRGVMRPVQLFAGLAQAGISLTPFAPASTVLGAAFYLISAADGVSSTYDAIESLLKDIMAVTRRIEVYSKDTMELALRQIVVEIICKMLEILARAERLAKRPRLLEYASTTFLGKDGKVQSLMDDLKKLTDIEAKMVVTLINQTTRQIERTGEAVSATTERIEKGVEGNTITLLRIEERFDEGRQEAKETEDQNALANLLGSKTFERTRDLFLDINEDRMADSGDWILEERLFQNWINQHEPLLWIFGKPGAGKTFLSSKIIHHLQSEKMSSTTFVTYFFIKEDNQDLRSIDSILKCIAFQVAQSDLLFRNFVSKVCKNSENLRNAETFWNTVFQDFFGSPRCSSSVFILLDGVDEAPRREREILLGLLHGLHSLRASSERPKIQIAVISRPDLQSDMIRQWGGLVEHVDVSADRNSVDIKNYIMREVDKVQMLRSKRLSIKDKNSLRQLIVDKLWEGDGTFQWIKLVLAEITHKKVKTDIIRALKAVPTDLLEIIGHIFDRIIKDPDIPQAYFREMLLWIACAKRPLTLGELQELLNFMPQEGGELSSDSENGEDDVEDEWPDLETDLRTSFASFLILTRADGKTTEALQKKRIANLNRIDEEDDEKGSGHLIANGRDLEYSDTSEEDDDPSREFREEFNSNPDTTEIQFTHASIRDFLFRKQRLMRDYVEVDQNQAHTHIAIGCLLLFANRVRMIGKDGKAPYSYATSYWADHLAQADPSKIPLEDRARVLKLLFRVLQDPDNAHEFFENCIKYNMESFQHICETLLQVTNNWASEDVLRTLSPEESSWVAKARTSISDLFECVALAVARRWLQTWDHLHEFHFHYSIEFLHQCFPMHDETETVVIGSTETFEGPIYSADTIRRLAQASNFEQDSRWHTRLGWVLTIYERLEDGCEEFTLALHLDPDNFRAQMWLAEAFAKQGKLNLAIEASLTTLNQCPPDLQFVIRDIWSNIRKWRYKLGDEEGAIEATKASFATGEEGPYGNLINFQMLHDLRQHQLIIDMVKTLDETPSQQVPGSLLDAFVRECCPYIVLGYAANAVGQLEYIDRIFKRAISNASHENDILGERRQRANYSWFVFAFKRDEGKALEMCKAVVSEYLASPPAKGFFQWDDRNSRQLAESLLIQLYLRKAIASHPDASTVWFTELQNLLQRLEALKMQETEASVYKNEGSSAMALWHRLYGQPDLAKRLLSELVLEGLRILTDADPDNDIQGYVILGKALLTFGDRRNAGVAFAVAGAPPNSFKKMQQQDREETPIPVNAAETTLTQPSTEPSDPTSAAGAARTNPAGSDVAEQEDPASHLPYGCAGECSRKTKTWTAYYRCEYCYDTGFCDECMELVKASKLPFRVCDSSHPFLQVYPIDLEMARVGASVENELIVPRAEWLDMLRREWMA